MHVLYFIISNIPERPVPDSSYIFIFRKHMEPLNAVRNKELYRLARIAYYNNNILEICIEERNVCFFPASHLSSMKSFNSITATSIVSAFWVPGGVVRAIAPRRKEPPGQYKQHLKAFTPDWATRYLQYELENNRRSCTCASPIDLLEAIKIVKRGGIPRGYSCLRILIHDQGKPSLMPIPPKSNIMM